MRSVWTWGALGAWMMTAACAATPESSAPAKTAGAIEPTPNGPVTCPLGMTGTQVAAVDTPDGVDVTFTTKGDLVELRQRVEAQAEFHGPGKHEGPGHAGVHAGAHTHGLRLTEIDAPMKATVTDVDGGSRLHVAATNASDLAKVRSGVHERAAKIVALGDCPP